MKYSDLLEMHVLYSRKKLGIRCVDVVSKNGHQIVLHGLRVSMNVKRWRLYRRYIDSTTVSCIQSLLEFDTTEDWKDVEVRIYIMVFFTVHSFFFFFRILLRIQMIGQRSTSTMRLVSTPKNVHVKSFKSSTCHLHNFKL